MCARTIGLIMLSEGPGFAESFAGVMQRDAVPPSVNPLFPAQDVGAPPAFRIADPIRSVPEWRGMNARTAQEIYD